jgi:hypothetical protein
MEDKETRDETWDQYLRYSKRERLKQASSDILGRVTVSHQLFSLGSKP